MSGSNRTRVPIQPRDACGQLAFRSSISSPQPPVIAKLNVGDLLNVVLQTIPQAAVLVEYQGATAGALVGTKMNSLINCLQNGYQFIAEVLEVAGGRCTVEVRPS